MQPRMRGISLTLGMILAITGVLLMSSRPLQQRAVAELNEIVGLHMLSHQATDASVAAVTDRFAAQSVNPADPGTGHDVPRPRRARDEGRRLVEEAVRRTAHTPFAIGMIVAVLGAGLFGLALPAERTTGRTSASSGADGRTG